METTILSCFFNLARNTKNLPAIGCCDRIDQTTTAAGDCAPDGSRGKKVRISKSANTKSKPLCPNRMKGCVGPIPAPAKLLRQHIPAPQTCDKFCSSP